MFSLVAYEYHRNKVFMKITRKNLRDSLDPFDMPDERYIFNVLKCKSCMTRIRTQKSLISKVSVTNCHPHCLILFSRFREMYRLPRSLALDFLHRLSDHIGDDNLCPDVPLTVQFCAALNFYASGSYQRRVGADGFAFVSQTVVSRCVQYISFIIATKMVEEFIRFPRSIGEIEKLHDQMQTHTDFPGAFAILDGSHIALTALPNQTEFAFMNRKGFHSINTQFVVDARMRFLNVNARYPGSTHDSLVWRSSFANSFLKNVADSMGGNWTYFMLADHGYPLQPWLLKPYDSPTSLIEQVYNARHRKLRSLIERVIGLLKARFRCLLGERKLHYDPLMSGYIIYACCVLHNFLVGNDYPIDNIDPSFDDEIPNFDEDMQIEYDELERGREIRDNVAEYFFDE